MGGGSERWLNCRAFSPTAQLGKTSGVWGIHIEDGAEVDDERLRIRPLGGRGTTLLFEELGRSHVRTSVAEGGCWRKEAFLVLE